MYEANYKDNEFYLIAEYIISLLLINYFEANYKDNPFYLTDFQTILILF